MKNDEYILCVDLDLEEGIKTYPLVTLDLKSLQLYTSYCNDCNHLINSVAKLNKNNEKIQRICAFIKRNMTSNCLSIRTINNRKTNIKVLLKDDEDVVLAKEKDLKTILYNYMITIDDIIKNNIPEEKMKVIKYISENFKSFFPTDSYMIENRRKERLNEYYYDKDYEKVSYPWQDLFLFKKNIDIFVNNIYKNYRKFQELGLYLKDVTKNKLFKTDYKVMLNQDKYGKNQFISLADLRRKELNFSLYSKHKKKYDESNILFIVSSQILNNFSFLDDKEKQEVKKVADEENKKPSLYDNPDFIKYLNDKVNEDKVLPSDDFLYADEEYDDFLGPRRPNDPRYWSIN